MSGRKVLIVDDDKDLLRALNVRLSANGYNVVFATDAISAVGTARKEQPDLIILDVGLPGGDGFMVMERIAFLGPLATIPIIIHTSRDSLTNKERALNAGAQAFLQKPVDNDVLLATIRKALGENGKQTPEKQIPVAEVAYTKAKKVLMVDDDKDLLRALNLRLSANSYNVVFATDAISAISVARNEQPDLIILDIGLPGGDGFTVMERMAFLGPLATIPIIILTGRDPFSNKERALSAGAQAFLQKPVDNDELLASIQKALGQNGSLMQEKYARLNFN